MAVTSSSNTPAKQTQPKQARQQQPSFTDRPMFGLNSYRNAFGGGGEQFEKITEFFTKEVKKLNEEKKTKETFNIVKIMKNVGLNYSAICLCETFNETTTAHVMMVEKTGDYPERLMETVGGIRYELLRVPADALDDRFMAQAQHIIAEELKVQESSIIMVDGTLVPSEFDATSESCLYDLFSSAMSAVHSEMSIRVNDYKGFNLEQILNEYRNGKFVIGLYFNPEGAVHFDQTGMPVRQDVCISLSFKTGQAQNNKSVNQGSDVVEISKTYGYIDFEWFPAQQNGMMMQQTRKFMPNFIITHIESGFAVTPDILMLAVASVYSVHEDMNWLQAFRPTPGKGTDYNDLGALNIEGNIEAATTGFGKKYDTKSKAFNVVELSKFADRLIHPQMTISIDIPKAGPDTWFMSVLQYVSRNSPDAVARLTDHMQTLTNGIYVPAARPLFLDVNNKIHGGFFKTKDGIRDLRHLCSYLGFANHVADTNQSPALLMQYTNTLYNNAIPTELRCAERKKYIDEMSGGTAMYKQMFDRITFNGAQLNDFINSLRMTGFAPIFANLNTSNDMFQRRSVADFGMGSIGGDMRFMNANNGYGNWNGMPNQYSRRW